MKLLFLIPCFLGSIYSSAQGLGFGMSQMTRQVDKETIRQLEQIQSKLKTASSPGAVRCEVPEGTTCDFTILCDLLRKNRNAEVLYQNPAGKVLANIPLIYSRQKADQCRNSVSTEEPKDPQKVFSENMRDYAAKRKEFLDSIARNGEQAAYFEIERSMVEISLESTDSISVMLDADAMEKKILQAETHAKVKLSEESRRLWMAVNSPSVDRLEPATNQNPFFDPMLLSIPEIAGGEEKVRENQRQFQAELTRTYNLFLDTKKEMIQILKARKNGKNNAEM